MSGKHSGEEGRTRTRPSCQDLFHTRLNVKFCIDSIIDSASCGKGPMPLSHFRIQASKAHINKPPKTSVRRVDTRREIPPALLPLLILPLLVYVALSSLLCSLPLLQTASNWHLKIQFWRQGRSHRLGVRTEADGRMCSVSSSSSWGRSRWPLSHSILQFSPLIHM